MTDEQRIAASLNRRAFLCRAGATVGTAALADLLGIGGAAADIKPVNRPSPIENPTGGIIKRLHHPAKVKRVIQLYMAGGPSHLETFDYKQKLADLHGQAMPESLTKGQPIAQLQGAQLKVFGPQHSFQRYGKSGQHFSTIFPHLGEVADDICIIRSLHTEAINHDPAHTYLNTGTLISGRPSMGSWLLYGLGTESKDLPGFVVLISTGKFGQSQPISARQWHSGFIPSRYAGIELRGKGDPVMYVRSPNGVDSGQQKDVIDSINQLNRMHDNVVHDPEIATRIAQYELAFQMQTSVPELMDVSKESKATLDMYGATPGDGTFASNCLLARRLAERGVRFIQLYHRDWDHHGALKQHVEGTAREVDQAMAALIKDLKSRGMFDDTLILWNGEFGRTRRSTK